MPSWLKVYFSCEDNVTPFFTSPQSGFKESGKETNGNFYTFVYMSDKEKNKTKM
jgi:hypothetical protein